MCTVFLTALSTGLQMAGQYQQGKSAQAAYEAQAKVAEQNKAIAQAEREQNSLAAAQQERKMVSNYEKAESQRRAAMGSVGLSSSVGSGRDLAGASRSALVQDAITGLSNQRANSWSNYITQVNYQNRANQSRKAGENAMEQTYLGMFGTLLGGIGSIYGKGGLLDKGSRTTTPSSDWYNLGMEKLAKGGAYANTSRLGFDSVTGTFGKSNPYPFLKIGRG